jgi:hypothetical protein
VYFEIVLCLLREMAELFALDDSNFLIDVFLVYFEVRYFVQLADFYHFDCSELNRYISISSFDENPTECLLI